jgi:hypothetical protein
VPSVTSAFQWFRGASSIANATNATYGIVAADSGNVLTVKIVGTNKYGSAYALATLPIMLP